MHGLLADLSMERTVPQTCFHRNLIGRRQLNWLFWNRSVPTRSIVSGNYTCIGEVPRPGFRSKVFESRTWWLQIILGNNPTFVGEVSYGTHELSVHLVLERDPIPNLGVPETPLKCDYKLLRSIWGIRTVTFDACFKPQGARLEHHSQLLLSQGWNVAFAQEISR